MAAANKRIANILRKTALPNHANVVADHLKEAAERALFERLQSTERVVNPALKRREYGSALTQLAQLREPVDAFFDSVMVMIDDEQLRKNRLALLSRLRALFLQIADLSRLPG